MSSVLISLCSAVLLGLYDLAKKHAVRDNAVFSVIFFGTVAGALFWLLFKTCFGQQCWADADVSDRPEMSGAGSNAVLWLIELFRRVPCLQSL